MGKPQTFAELIPVPLAAALGNVIVVEKTPEPREGVFVATRGFLELCKAPASILDWILGERSSSVLTVAFCITFVLCLAWTARSPSAERPRDPDPIRSAVRQAVRMIRRTAFAFLAGLVVASVAWASISLLNNVAGFPGQVLAAIPLLAWWQFVFFRFMDEQVRLYQGDPATDP